MTIDPHDRPRAPEPTGTHREAFENSADAILIIEGDTFVDCNQATVSMLRYRTKQELLQTHPSELSPPRQPDGRASFEKANEMIAVAFERGSNRFEWNHRRADGEVFPVEVLLTAIGERLHVVWRDITERKNLEAELRQAQKMDAIGKLAGGVAHDFNNLLVSILGHAELLKEALTQDSDLGEHVDEIRRAGGRAADLVGQLLAFSRKQDLKPQTVELNALIGDLSRLLIRVIGERVTVATDLADRPLHVKADPGQLEQVVVNLAANARDAMPRGGTLSLRTRLVTMDGTPDRPGLDLEPGAYVVLTVSDTGVGMDAMLVEQIFEPFFTTKRQGEGTGLGLASTYGVIRQSGGDISVKSEPGQGTEFRIYLPHTNDPVPAVQASEPPASLAAGRETVLLVEDENVVADLMERVLVRAGYQVIRRCDGRDALDNSQVHEFDLLLTDVVMPRVGGIELARQLTARRPDLPVLFISGYTDSALAYQFGGDVKPDLLQKPFKPQELLQRVREALDRGRST